MSNGLRSKFFSALLIVSLTACKNDKPKTNSKITEVEFVTNKGDTIIGESDYMKQYGSYKHIHFTDGRYVSTPVDTKIDTLSIKNP